MTGFAHDFKPVKPGDNITAKGENELREALNLLMRTTFDEGVLYNGAGIFKRGKKGRERFLAKADANVTAGNSGTFSLYSGATQGSEADTTRNVTAYARFADITSGDWVFLSRIRGSSGWEVEAAGGGGGGGCSSQNAWHDFTLLGSPSGGSIDVDYTINATTETLTFDYDFTAGEVQTAMLTHSELTSGDVFVGGGAFPDATIRVQFQGNFAATAIYLPLVDFSGLTGGVGAIVSMAQVGIA